MKAVGKFCSLMLLVIALFAQAPPPRGGERSGFGPRFEWVGPGPRTPVTGAPYSGVQATQSQQTLADGNQITRQEQSKVYRDSQGRVRIEHPMNRGWATAGKTPQTVITIFDPVAGYSYMLNPATMTAVKRPLPPPKSTQGDSSSNSRLHAKGPGISGAQVQTENLGTQTISGVSAAGTRTTETIPAGAIGNQQPLQVVRETWVSADLKVPVLIKSSDPRFGNMTMQLTNIVQTEPDPTLFQIPSSYTVTAHTAGTGRWRQ